MIGLPKPRTAIIIMVLTVLGLYGYGSRLIFSTVRTVALEAQATYSGDPVVALIALVEDETAPFDKRNSAIWALGQIGDKQALPVLQELDTHEVQSAPYDSTAYIVQYSLDKALKQMNGISLTRWMYRWL